MKKKTNFCMNLKSCVVYYHGVISLNHTAKVRRKTPRSK